MRLSVILLSLICAVHGGMKRPALSSSSSTAAVVTGSAWQPDVPSLIARQEGISNRLREFRAHHPMNSTAEAVMDRSGNIMIVERDAIDYAEKRIVVFRVKDDPNLRLVYMRCPSSFALAGHHPIWRETLLNRRAEELRLSVGNIIASGSLYSDYPKATDARVPFLFSEDEVAAGESKIFAVSSFLYFGPSDLGSLAFTKSFGDLDFVGAMKLSISIMESLSRLHNYARIISGNVRPEFIYEQPDGSIRFVLPMDASFIDRSNRLVHPYPVYHTSPHFCQLREMRKQKELRKPSRMGDLYSAHAVAIAYLHPNAQLTVGADESVYLEWKAVNQFALPELPEISPEAAAAIKKINNDLAIILDSDIAIPDYDHIIGLIREMIEIYERDTQEAKRARTEHGIADVLLGLAGSI